MPERLEEFRGVGEEDHRRIAQANTLATPTFGRACFAWSRRRKPCSGRSTRTSPTSTSTRWPGSTRASRPRIEGWDARRPRRRGPPRDFDQRRRPCRPTSSTPGSGMPLGPFWDAGAHAVAVEQAAKSVTAHTQHETGCQLADDDLMSQVWSDEPPKAGRPRLRFPGDRNTKTWQSRQRGARSLAQGCYGGTGTSSPMSMRRTGPTAPPSEYLACLSFWPLDQRSRGRRSSLTCRVVGPRWSARHREPLVLGGHERSPPS